MSFVFANPNGVPLSSRPRSHKSSTGYVRSALPLPAAGLDRERISSKRTCHIITATDPYKDLVTTSDQPCGLELGPPIHSAHDVDITMHRQELDGLGWRLGMDIVIGSRKETYKGTEVVDQDRIPLSLLSGASVWWWWWWFYFTRINFMPILLLPRSAS